MSFPGLNFTSGEGCNTAMGIYYAKLPTFSVGISTLLINSPISYASILASRLAFTFLSWPDIVCTTYHLFAMAR